jgi:predicted secreted Zn-dependent protease
MGLVAKRLLAAITVLMAFTLAHSASARVIINERTKFYTVSGKTGPQLFKSILRRGPKVRNVGHAIASTGTALKIRNIKTVVNRRECKVTNVDVIVDITYTLPRWTGSRGASAKVRDTWKQFNARVLRHEQTHGRISREYAREVEKKIKQARGRASRNCKNFGKRQLRSLARLQRNIRKRHERFDRREGRARSRIRLLQRSLIKSN